MHFMLDLLITNAEVVDGTGAPSFKADVGIAGKRIVAVVKNIDQEAHQTIQAEGLTLSPGFIDPHMHSGLTLLFNGRAESSIHQGVTTEIIGNCGFSPAPVNERSKEEVVAFSLGFDVEINWESMGDYLGTLRKSGMALNVVPLVGHNTVRGTVMGYGDTQPTPDQQAAMERLTAETMEQGARGISTGLFYPPGVYAKKEEIIGLSKAVSKFGGMYTSHIRSESDAVLVAVQEAIDIGVKANIPVEISHVKISGYRNWEMIDELAELLESDVARDVLAGCDQYPYNASSTYLSSILPYWAQEGGGKAVAQRMKEGAIRERLRKDWETNQVEWDHRSGARDWNGVLITGCLSRPEVIGMTVEEIASQDGMDPFDTALDLIALDEGQIIAVYFCQHEDIVRQLMKHPLVVVGSDSAGAAPYGDLGQIGVHPRTYGTFPRVLGHYVREEGVLSLEEAIQKMTSLTAERFNLTDRGVIKEGAWADVVLFDPQTVSDKATFIHPHQYPVGIPYVIVNGEIVISQGEHTGALPGDVL
jgi:N-acyl-D-amino-acid deacylase